MKNNNEIFFNLSEKAKNIILKKLDLNSIEEILSEKYKDFNSEDDINRKQTKKYLRRVRGSIRLREGRFYTASEFSDRINTVKALKLP